MRKNLTIQLAVEEFKFYDLYNEIIDSYTEDLDDPTVFDLYELIVEYDEEYEFLPDLKGNYTASFERNLRQAIATIIERAEELSFVDDEFEDDEVPEIYGENFDNDSGKFDLDSEDDEEPHED
ncbi:MAG: hypothetical protein L3J69_06330 [Desulfobacula sp.]|nr:hypothetical protein [Desulfobacula sp.]